MADVRKTIEVQCESLRILVAKACLVAQNQLQPDLDSKSLTNDQKQRIIAMYSRQIKEKTESLNSLIANLLHLQTEAQKLQQIKADSELQQKKIAKKR